MKFKEFFLEKWYASRGEPIDKPSDLGYFESDDYIGKRIWVHTNRTNRNNNRNGMIGVYYPKESARVQKRTEKRYGYTNDVRLVDCVFDVNKPCIKRIKETGDRKLCAGILGTVVSTEGGDGGYVPFVFNPMEDVDYNYLAGDSSKREVIGAGEVHLYATESGDYIQLLKNPVFKEEAK